MASRDADVFQKQVLSLLASHPERAYRPKELSKLLGITNHSRYQTLLETVDALRDERLVERAPGGRIRHLEKTAAEGTGTLTVHPDGFGFVTLDVPPGGAPVPDVFVRAMRMGTALHGDRVRVALAAAARHRDPDDLRHAEIVEVVERRLVQTVGTLTQTGRAGWVKPDDRRITHDVYVPRDAWAGAEPGDKVVVSIDAFDDPKAAPEGRILSVLGRAGEPGVDVLALALALGAPRTDFPAAVDRQAEAAAAAVARGIPADEIARRVDLRHLPVFTIDPEDAKDFDDAIHTRELEGGLLEVGVHIADVSHFVRPGTDLDAEAFARATSTYLVDRVIPMLPEALSNGACSLRPREDKLAYSCLLRVRPESGKVLDWRFAETVIHSAHRFTYAGAQDVLDGLPRTGSGEEDPGGLPGGLAEELRRAGALAEVLTARRMREGAIDFDVPEIRVVLGPDGVPVDVVPTERRPANRLVEEFMLLANRAAALEPGERAHVYRVHDAPDRERIAALADFVKPFGHTLAHDRGAVERSALNALLREVKGRPEAPIVEQAAVRAMSKAVYAARNIGHFGLGFSHYTHFTSPIRRYPDLIAHRLLKRLAAGAAEAAEDTLAEQARHCSEREKAATEAERESIRLKQVEYAAAHIGESFDGVVVSVTKFGAFVQMTRLLTEGLVHVREMAGDYWEYDAARYQLVGRSSGRRIRTGDVCRVRLVAAEPATRRVDLVFEELPGADAPPPSRRDARARAVERKQKRRG